MDKRKQNVRDARRRLWREEVIRRDGTKCLSCGGAQNVYVREILSSKLHDGLQYDVSNGLCLCAKCTAEFREGDYVTECRLLVMKSKCDNNQKDTV